MGNAYIQFEVTKFMHCISFFLRAGLLFNGRVLFVFPTIGTTLYLYMRLKCYVFNIVWSTLNFAFHEQNRCPSPVIELPTILFSVWLPINFLSALVPADCTTEADSQIFQARRQEVGSSLWDFTLDKLHSHSHQPCQGPLDFNMIAERELREIIAWAAQSVPAQRDHHH